MSIQLQPSIPLVKLVKTEPPTVIKNEPSEEALEKEISPDIKDIDIVHHSLSEDLIKSETVPENILETKYSESVETQVLVKIEDTDTSDENVTKKHKDTKDIQWFQCNLHEMKFKLKSKLSQHMKVHLKHKQMKDGLNLCEKRQLQSSVPLVTLVKTKPPTVIRNEPPEEALEKEISPDIKGIDIVYHSLSEDLIKNETVLENLLETKYSESVETQVLVKTENTSDENVTRGTDQEVVEVQGSYEHSNTLSNLETHEQLVLNSSNGTTSWNKERENIRIIRACNIPVESQEYTSLAEDEHVCNHCQHAYKRLHSLKYHISKMHREITTMNQCPYCPYESKWSLRNHIIQKHKDTKDIQWSQCNLCEVKFKLKSNLTQHMNKVHLKHKQMKDGLDLHEKRHDCDQCDYKTDRSTSLKRHKNLLHLKPEEMEYFYCYHCFYKSKQKSNLKIHIFRQHFKNVKQGKRYCCNKCDYETYTITQLKRHKLNHLKPEDIPYFYCYHCSYKSKEKVNLQRHIFKHLKNGEVKFDCYICNFMTQRRESIIAHIKKHSKVKLKFEVNEGS